MPASTDAERPVSRLPRLAIAVLPGLDHFIPDLARALAATGAVQPRVFAVRDMDALTAMLAWADHPDTDAIWFEFCWPPFPALIAAAAFGGRRVVVRVHRIEAYGADHVARADWSRVSDVIVVGRDMAARVRAAAPEIDMVARLHVIHNGLDLARFRRLTAFDPFRIGWCGWMSLHKNPTLALEILHRLRAHDARYTLHVSSRGGEPVALDAFRYLARRMELTAAICDDGAIGADAMPSWHAANGVLLSTSLYESFGYAIAEAAACGCDVAILDNAAADEFWPQAARFATVDEAVALIRDVRPHRWSDLVARRFDVREQARRVLQVLGCEPAGFDSAGFDSAGFNSAGFDSAGFDSAGYWEQRYARGGTSGAGSCGRLARFKAATVNAIVAEHDVGSVIEFGCGDGTQLMLAEYRGYIGIDVSAAAIARCRARFADDPGKRFLLLDEAGGQRADMAVSLDVIFHLVEDAVFDRYMRALFAAADRLVVIYASDREAATADAHVRHRAFSAWVDRHAPDWRRVRRVANPYPFDPARPDDSSFADFHLYARRKPAPPGDASP